MVVFKMDGFLKTIQKLKELNIEYELIEHELAITTFLADKFIEGIEGVRTKTLFLTNRNKKNFYLVIVDEYKRLDIPSFKEIFNEKQIKIAWRIIKEGIRFTSRCCFSIWLIKLWWI